MEQNTVTLIFFQTMMLDKVKYAGEKMICEQFFLGLDFSIQRVCISCISSFAFCLILINLLPILTNLAYTWHTGDYYVTKFVQKANN